MGELYKRINWENYPSTKTPRNAENLNIMDKGIKDLDVKAENIQQQLNTIVVEGDSSVEAAQARVTEKGKEYDTLKDRLDDTDRSIPLDDYDGKKYIINNPYRFGGSLSLKGQLHCHTTNSDGVDSPEDVVTAYKNAGYDFVAITDHNYITPDPGVPGIIFIQSTEETYETHVTAYDVDELSGEKSPQDIINFEVSKGKICSIAHSNWSIRNIDKNELVGFYDYNFTEIFNGLISYYADTADDKVDAVLTSGKRLFYIATDDCHNVSHYFNKGWVVVHTDTASKEAILDNLRKGNFYASTGNDILISVIGDTITATSTESSNILFIGMGGKVLKSTTGTTASYTIKGNEMYVRVKSIKESDGTIAWAQPIFIETAGGDERHKLNYTRNSNLYGIKRQAIINGGFIVNQRGSESETFENESHIGYFVDGWFNNQIVGSVFPPSITRYRRELTWPDTAYGRYCIGVSWSGPEPSPYTQATEAGIFQRIEHGTRDLCGIGKKIALSFWARATTAPKKLGVIIKQRYGTGGSPSASEDILGGIFELKTTFDKYEITVETKTLKDKMFGSNNDDYLQVGFYYMWHGNPLLSPDENFGSANGIEIAQVQLNAGDMSLPYCERPESEELRICQRYFQKSSLSHFVSGYMYGANNGVFLIPGNVPMRTNPTLTIETGDLQTWAGESVGYSDLTFSSLGSDATGIKLFLTSSNNVTPGLALISECKFSASAEL